MRQEPINDRDREPPPSTPAVGRRRELGRELEQLRRLDALIGDIENPHIWRGVD